MIEFFAESFLPVWEELGFHWALADKSIRDFGGDGNIGDGQKQGLLRILQDIKSLCAVVQLPSSEARQVLFHGVLTNSLGCSHRMLQTEIKGLQSTISKELSERRFAFIPPDKAEYFEQVHLFGPAVWTAFPCAEPDIKAAGNCLAADLNTAAVFHLMRAAEFGLRALARHLRVRIKNKPIEYAVWGEIIDNIQAKIASKIPKKKGKRKADALVFYHGALGEFNAFKDVWRNNVMHTRGEYNAHQAVSAYLHVRGFMQRLAERITQAD
jgi:hypothetical protein